MVSPGVTRATGGLVRPTPDRSRLRQARCRVVIDAVRPCIDAGRFAIKRTVGEEVVVTADLFADSHDILTARVLYRPIGAPAGPVRTGWQEAPMEGLGNDRWLGRFRVERIGRYEYTVLAWVDRFGSWLADLRKRIAAGQENLSSELMEGAQLIAQTAVAAPKRWRGAGEVGLAPPSPVFPTRRRAHLWLAARAAEIGRDGDQAARVSAALDPVLADIMRAFSDRQWAVRHEPALEVIVDRERARFGAWYEMFPRSAGPDPTRSATFDEAATRLPEIAAMGFDVLYLPPIHPIGRTHRKGPNNKLGAGDGEPGSPWAIGSEAGGHKAVEPGLGTLDDFDRFVAAARRHGLDVALDLAYQASPDHPYVRAHPEWFRHRPDGTIKYAENPPKKYQDIYPFEFESDAAPALWVELKSIVDFWIDQGVTIFRVDNPHTKPFAFWEWLIGAVKRVHPEVIFLSEAFTRPKVMKYLAKCGFSQSYTYFTWRNTKAELTEYFTELCQADVREYLRPNLFANTPDILHAYLQGGGRAAFMVRLVLAATLGASYGIYSGFELCENRAVPGTEEYVDSEKYQYRQWDGDRPGHIKDLIARVNRIRREHPALHSDWSLRFHATDNDELICYSKAADEGDRVLVVVNLDPIHLQHGWVQVPLSEWAVTPDTPYSVLDLLSGERYSWRGEWNYVRLDPGDRPAHILTLST